MPDFICLVAHLNGFLGFWLLYTSWIYDFRRYPKDKIDTFCLFKKKSFSFTMWFSSYYQIEEKLNGKSGRVNDQEEDKVAWSESHPPPKYSQDGVATTELSSLPFAKTDSIQVFSLTYYSTSIYFYIIQWGCPWNQASHITNSSFVSISTLATSKTKMAT